MKDRDIDNFLGITRPRSWGGFLRLGDDTVYLYTCSGDPANAGNWSRTSLGSFSDPDPGDAYVPGALTLNVSDMDQDGSLDILFTNHQENSATDDLYLLRNPYPGDINTAVWDKYVIGHYDAREIATGDVDNDGDMDVIIVEQDEDAVIWLENNGLTFCEDWIAHTIDVAYDSYLEWAHGVGVADIDGNGLLDVAVAAAHGDTFQLYCQTPEPSTLTILITGAILLRRKRYESGRLAGPSAY
ncbi:MAG: VCBS repeat-containing protein [Phycisphaerae bacterium]|nr:VCBS repeat-containing protein [Phycisphaerae bacterium]